MKKRTKQEINQQMDWLIERVNDGSLTHPLWAAPNTRSDDFEETLMSLRKDLEDLKSKVLFMHKYEKN